MDERLQQETETKTALITGASSGIGMATAHVLAELGYNVIITGRRARRLQRLADELEAEYGIKAHPVVFDIRERVETETAIEALPEAFRRIDLLVNNAGLAAGLEPIPDGDPNDWDAMINTNIRGMLYITRIVSRMMIRRGKGGHIVNIGSIAGTQTYANGGVYCASKHAVHALSQGMRIDLLPHGIKVTEVRPGMTETEFSVVRFHGDKTRAATVYEGVEALSADDIAEVIGWIAQLPPHVNVNDIEITPTQQANSFYTFRKTKA